MPQSRDYYEVLGIGRDANEADIKGVQELAAVPILTSTPVIRMQRRSLRK